MKIYYNSVLLRIEHGKQVAWSRGTPNWGQDTQLITLIKPYSMTRKDYVWYQINQENQINHKCVFIS